MNGYDVAQPSDAGAGYGARGHPAVRAWETLQVPGPPPDRIVDLPHVHPESATYRVCWTARASCVVAKRGPASAVGYEARVYQLLAELPLSAPRLLGMVAEDEEGNGWLFLEDVGDRALDLQRADHRILGARWLAMLHTSAAQLATGDWLVDRTPPHFRRVLRKAHTLLVSAHDDREFDAEGRRLVAQVADRLERLETSWDVVEDDARRLPQTLIHADFVEKNVRLSSNRRGADPDVLPIDWATAGRGSPAIDIWNVDLSAYRAARGDAVPLASLRRVARAGWAFWLVLLTSWAAQRANSRWPENALQAQLPSYLKWLDELGESVRRDRV